MKKLETVSESTMSKEEQLELLLESMGNTDISQLIANLQSKAKAKDEKVFTDEKEAFMVAVKGAILPLINRGIRTIKLSVGEGNSLSVEYGIKTVQFGSDNHKDVTVLLRNGDKTYSGRGIQPLWIATYLLSTEAFEKSTSTKINNTVSSKFAEHGVTQETHDLAWELLRNKYPV